MQDNQLHGNLTVEEAMTVATNLKLSPKVEKNEKNFVVSKFKFANCFYFYVLCYRYWLALENIIAKMWIDAYPNMEKGFNRQYLFLLRI